MKNRITYLCNSDSTESTTQEEIAATLTTYFQNIFTSQFPSSLQFTDHSQSRIPTGHQIEGAPNTNDVAPSPTTLQPDMLEFTAFTNSQPSIQELHVIIKEMRSNASPGPDGLNAAFYKSA
jgi:hypothetical protein